MKIICIVLVYILFSLFCVETILAADPYLEFLKQFYYLDDQRFEQVTCQVVVPEFDTLRAQMKSLENKVAVRENFDEFRLTYKRGKGLFFNLPSFEVSLVSEVGIKDRSKMETGMKMLKDGAEYFIQGVVQILNKLFKEYELQDKKEIKNVEVVKNNNETQLRYEKDSAKVTIICTDGHCKTSKVQPPLRSDSDDEYEQVGNKLLLKSSNSYTKQNRSTIHNQVAVEYQKVSGVLFPSTITTEYETVRRNIKDEGRTTILLKGCKAN